MIALTSLMTLGLFAGTASARPGDRGDRGDRWGQHNPGNDGRDNDGDGWVDEYDENTSYAMPDFERRVRHGQMTFREVRRFMRMRMQDRIAEKTMRIHARFGYNRIAYRKIARMKARERARFQNRLAVVRARFDQIHREARRDRWERRHDARVGYDYNYGGGEVYVQF
ncbi:MAG: hypothetical protein EP329_28050 [Deltaproteobacteria bacterium]|nr:MAG: hypothetical protein EP329_28050 [Deltaproteobacteria bacterium]